MVNYSLSTVYMTLLTSNLLLVLIACFFRSKKIMVNLGYRLLAVFVILTFIRFLFPFELPFTQNIYLPKYISFIVIAFRHPFLPIAGHTFSLWNIMEGIWLIGSIIFATRYIREIRLTKQFILFAGKTPACIDKYNAILNDICHLHKRKNHFTILEIEHLDSPKLYGIRKPYILLPDNLTCSDEDMYFILHHEATHHFHCDILTKALVRIMSIVYWWNPACHSLNKHAGLLLEMRTDDNVADKKNHEKTSHYLGCLISLAEHARKQKKEQSELALSFSQFDQKILTKRFEMLIGREEPHNLALNIATTVTILLIYVLSFFYTFEAFYSPADVAATISITKTDSYFIENEDATYDLYYQGIHLDTVTSLEYYMDDVPVYTQEEYNEWLAQSGDE